MRSHSGRFLLYWMRDIKKRQNILFYMLVSQLNFAPKCNYNIKISTSVCHRPHSKSIFWREKYRFQWMEEISSYRIVYHRRLGTLLWKLFESENERLPHFCMERFEAGLRNRSSILFIPMIQCSIVYDETVYSWCIKTY